MNVGRLDLNLLIALDALLTEGGVAAAARRLGLSQPALSHALRRLRDATGDALLVRVGPRMELTPRARRLRDPVRSVLRDAGALFAEDAFDPATSRRRFTVMMPDLVVSILMPPLVRRLEMEAPLIRLEVTPWRGEQLFDPGFARSVDLVATYIGDVLPGFRRQVLYRDTDVLAVRRGRAQPDALSSLKGFTAARHVAIIGRGERADPVDAWLGSHGVQRDTALIAPSYLQALQIAAETDLVAFVPSRLAAALADRLGLALLRPPLDPGIDEQFLFHPTRLDADPASIWLRGLVLQVGKGLGEATMTGSP
jgi:DNA-binding transcriptional LysR family regulator